MTDRRSAAWRLFRDETSDDAVRPSDLIRPQRAPTPAWTVFEDVDDSHNQQRQRATRDSRVRRRPTEWDLDKDESEHNKENIGYEVRRPKRVRRASPTSHDDLSTTESTQEPASPSSTPATPSPPKNKGKRKLKTPTPPHDKTTKKPKKIDARVPPEREPAPEPAPQPARRPLEDITHLFIDPTAHYFRPWRRASRVAMRAAMLRRL